MRQAGVSPAFVVRLAVYTAMSQRSATPLGAQAASLRSLRF